MRPINRYIQLIAFICKAIWLRITASRQSVVLLAQFTPHTGTHTYFKQALQFFCTNGYQVTVCVHQSVVESVQSLQGAFSFEIVDYGSELDFFEYFGKNTGRQQQYLLDKYLPKAAFLLAVLQQHKAAMIWVSSQYPTQLFPAFFLPVKVYYVVHAILWGKADDGANWLLQKRIRFGNLRFVTVSSAAATAITENWLVPKHFITVIPNYYQPHYGKGVDKMQQCQKRVLCIGTLDANKQPHLFVQLAKKAHKQFGEKVSFVWLGDGSLWSECKIAATELPNLHFVGSVTNPDDYYASSHIYLQPSITESQGIAILGAMYHALPCIVTNQGGPKEMVQHGTNGFVVDTSNETDMYSYLEELLLQDELCAQMGLAGKHICMQNYLIDQWIHRMHTLLRTQKLGS